MKTLWATILAAALAYCTPVQAQEQEAPKLNMFGKPVICAQIWEAPEMWKQIKDDNMVPLLGFRGNSFLQDGTKFESDYIVLYDHEEQQITIIERQDNGFQCLIAGGTGNVIFDPDELEALTGWDDF